MAIYKLVSNCLRFAFLTVWSGILPLLFINVVHAADGGINSALAEAGCVQASIKRLPPIGTVNRPGLLVLPLVGAAFILAQRGDEASVNSNARYAALITTIATFILALVAWGRFDSANPGFQMVETHGWVSEAIKFKLGVDGFSFPFVVLTAFLMPFCILASWTSVEKRVREYMVAFLILETLMIGVFVALDLVLFYLFFEAGCSTITSSR